MSFEIETLLSAHNRSLQQTSLWRVGTEQVKARDNDLVDTFLSFNWKLWGFVWFTLLHHRKIGASYLTTLKHHPFIAMAKYPSF